MYNFPDYRAGLETETCRPGGSWSGSYFAVGQAGLIESIGARADVSGVIVDENPQVDMRQAILRTIQVGKQLSKRAGWTIERAELRSRPCCPYASEMNSMPPNCPQHPELEAADAPEKLVTASSLRSRPAKGFFPWCSTSLWPAVCVPGSQQRLRRDTKRVCGSHEGTDSALKGGASGKKGMRACVCERRPLLYGVRKEEFHLNVLSPHAGFV
jgi:hypothetical protein